MDHLPSPKGCNLGDLYRPNCVAGDYDGGPMDFLEWPKTSRWPVTYSSFFSNNVTGMTNTFRDSDSIRACEMLLQTWLFFGLLHTFLHDIAGPEHFILVGDDVAFIHTRYLGPMLDKFGKRPVDPRVVVYRSQCLGVVFDMLTRARTTVPGLDKNILLSIIILAEVLERANQQSGGQDPREHHPSSIKWAHLAMQHDLFGFGKQLRHRLGDHFVASSVYMHECQRLFKAMPPVKASAEGYRHCCARQDCKIVEVDVRKVQTILESGDTAVLRPSSSGVEVIPASKCSGYVAISHVWTHGLGNPAGNKLPQCQISAVMDAARRLCKLSRFSKPVVWLDTLCCPVVSPRHRNLCHLRMEKIYRDAAQVLIIDPHLCRLSCKGVEKLQIAAWLALSEWNTRIWTFQEGLLAKRLYLQMLDGFVDIEELRAAVIEKYFLEQMPAIAPIAQIIDYIRPESVSGPRGKGIDSFNSCRNLMRYRQLSVPADETLCLSVCLGLDQREIIASTPEQRMSAFWGAYIAAGKTIPRSVIFFYGDRLSIPGQRWSPSSIVFLGVWHIEPRDLNRHAALGPSGLSIEYPGFLLTGKSGHPDRRYRACRTGDGTWYTLCHNTEESLQKYHLPFPPVDQESVVLIAEAGLSELEHERDIDCLGGRISHTEGDVLHLVPHGSCSIEKVVKNMQGPKERAWQGLQALVLSTGSETEARKLVETMPDDHETLLQSEIRSEVEMSIGHYRRLVLEMLVHPVLELTELWPETQKWCVA